MALGTPHPRTVALERLVTIEIRAGDLVKAIELLRLAQQHELDRKPVTFLDLPPELRTRIYELSGCLWVKCNEQKKFGFVSTDRADIDSLGRYRHMHDSGMSLIPVPLGLYKSSVSTSRLDNEGAWIRANYNRSVAQQPDLARVCHQVRDDTLPMFYGSNHFVLTGDFLGTSYLEWLRLIGPTNAASLRTVTLSLGVKPDRSTHQQQIIEGATAIFQRVRTELGQQSRLNAAWFRYDWPYLENVDILDTELA